MDTKEKIRAAQPGACASCHDGRTHGFDFSMAFQPIVDTTIHGIFGYEALVRGPHGEPAPSVLRQVHETNRYSFDQCCRTTAIRLASRLGLSGYLSINFLPNAVYNPRACIRATLEASQTHKFPSAKLMFEVVEGEKVANDGHLLSIFHEYKRQGFLTALDDFGEGYSGLNLLAEFQPDIIKLDMALIRDIHRLRPKWVIVRAIAQMCRELGSRVLAEGVENAEEFACLSDLGIDLFQGYLFARPAFERLPTVDPGLM